MIVKKFVNTISSDKIIKNFEQNNSASQKPQEDDLKTMVVMSMYLLPSSCSAKTKKPPCDGLCFVVIIFLGCLTATPVKAAFLDQLCGAHGQLCNFRLGDLTVSTNTFTPVFQFVCDQG